MRDDTPLAVQWTLDFLARLVSGMCARLGEVVFLPRALHRRLARELAELEACARRTLVVMAAQLLQSQAMARADATPPSPYGMAPLAQAQGARPGAARWWEGLGPSAANLDARALMRRLAALSAVLEAPQAAARHMAGQLRRIARRRVARTLPFGLGRRVWRGDPLRNVLSSATADMHQRALAGLSTLGP